MSVLLVFLLVFCATPAHAVDIFSAAQNERGNSLYEKGQVSKAKKAYEAALKGAPKSPEIAFNLGNAYYKEQAFGESLKRYAHATQNEKEPLFRSRAFYNLGNAFHRAGQADKAIEAYKQALRLNPKDLDAKYNLELLNKKKKEDNKKKPDEKKDQDKKDQDKKDQSQKDQNQQGGGGSGDQKDQQDQKGEQGEGGDAGKDQQDKGEQQSKGEQGQQEKEQGSEQSSEGDSKGDSKSEEAKEQESQQGQDRSSGQGGGDEERQAQEQEAQSGKGEQLSEPEPVKTDAQKRAEQILEALQGQEQQVFRMQNKGERRRGRAQQVMERDW